MRITVTVLSVCFFSVLPGSAVVAVEGNLIANPGFEQVDAASGFAAFWAPTYWSNPHGKVTLSAEGRTGERCVKITGVPPAEITDGTPRNNNLVAQQLEPPIRGVRKLTLVFWLKAAQNAKAFCSVMTRDAQSNRLQYVSSTMHQDATEWTRLLLPISTAPETAQLIVYLRNDGEGPVWIDDVSLTAADDVLENGLVRAHIEPLVGGRLRSLVIKKSGRDATLWEGVRPGGMAAEIVPADGYPGLLRDSACDVKVLERSKRVQVTHGPLPEPFDGLVIEKELALRGDLPVLDVRLRVSNQAADARSFALRAQQCLPPRQITITVPMAGQLRLLRHEEGLAKWGMDLNDLDAGWIACSDAESEDTVLFLFDRDEVEKAYLYRNQDLQTVEWYYREVSIPPGGAWETRYAIAALHSGNPIVTVSGDVAVGLSPLTAAGDADRSLAVSMLGVAATARVTATAQADGPVDVVEREVSLRPGKSAVVGLPWQGTQVKSMTVNVRTDDSEAVATISPMSLDTSPLMDLPPPPERLAEFPAATGFFPYGEYFRGYVKDAGGNVADHVSRQLRAYRRCYMNTYMSSESGLLSNFKKRGTVPMLEEVRKRRMRMIPRADMMRRFERDANRRILRELPPEPPTREVILARLARGGFTLDLRRDFVKTYGDLILAYDFADEPQGQYIPNYMMLQSVYREVDPEHPVLVILNLNRTEFLPFTPIYYGDEYPVRNAKRGGRNPWAVTKMVRFCATHTKAPVWVMLQAFGGLPEYTWQLPNEAEMRLIIYEAVANGCKGITFHGSSSPPCWRYNLYYFDTARDSWGVEAPAWTAMREAGRHVTAIGFALLLTDVSDAEVLNVACETMADEAVSYRGPAVKTGVLRQRGADGYFAVVVNQDVKRRRRATLSVKPDAVPEGAGLHDLYDLTGTGGPAPTEHTLELAPGDGRIFFVGTKVAAEPVLAAVHKGHYDNELPLYEIDFEVAVANRCDTNRAAAIAADAAMAHDAAQFAIAHARIRSARKALADAIAANTALADAQRSLSEAQTMLSAVALTYRHHFDVVVPSDLRKGATRGVVWKNTHDPKMQTYVDDTADALCLRMTLENKVRAGQAEQTLPEIRHLRQTATRLEAEAIPYVLSHATPPE